MSISEAKKSEISEIVKEIREGTRYFGRIGVDIADPFETGEATQIIKRIQERIFINMQAASDHGEQREVVG
jgi:hypothetical protein